MNGSDTTPDPAPYVDDLVGAMIADKYEIQCLIARGGMGQVYEAIQHPLGRRVAIKVLRPQATTHEVLEDFKIRFLREAAAYARLAHANTVTMFDYGTLPDDQDTLYMVMELVRGQTLKVLISEQQVLDVGRALRITYQVALSLREAHRMGVVHRDLKPSNIMVKLHHSRPDTVKVLDFGLAKILDPETSGSLSFAEDYQHAARAGPSVTQHGVVIGSPAYMAPEQIEGENVDKRTDLYSLGVILYEMLTGKQPFTGLNSIETLMQHLNAEVPSLYEANPAIIVPDEVEDLVMRCLEKQPDARFAGADELMQAIRDTAPPRGLGELQTEDVPLGPPIAPNSDPEESSILPYALAALAAIGMVVVVLLLT